jgi:hypothetical protein
MLSAITAECCPPSAWNRVRDRAEYAVGTGLIIASSTTHIAYFDITIKHGRLIKFEDGELTGWMP